MSLASLRRSRLRPPLRLRHELRPFGVVVLRVRLRLLLVEIRVAPSYVRGLSAALGKAVALTAVSPRWLLLLLPLALASGSTLPRGRRRPVVR